MTTGKYISHTILSVIMLLTGNACSRFEVETASPAGRDIPISFSASVDENQSKGIFTPENFSRPGHEIAVLDILDDGTFHIGGVNVGGEVAPAIYTSQDPSSPYWSDGKTYYWTPSGVHNFFAYATKYAKSNDPELNDEDIGLSDMEGGYSFEKDGDTYSMILEDWVIDVDKQFDLIYARHSRNMNEANPFRNVELEFHHLFAAVGFRFINITNTRKYTVTNWHFTNLKNKATRVAIPLTDNGSDISMELSSDGEQQLDCPTKDGYQRTDIYNDKGPVSIYTDEGYIGMSEHFLIWPHSYEDLKNVKFHFEYYPSNGSHIPVTLNMGGDDCDFDINRWEAGTKYMYNITISDNKIYWDVNIVPWITDDVILDER